MESLQLLPVCFLLFSTSFSDVQTKFHDFKCDENVTAEIGGNIHITCLNNEKIIDMTVTFCTNKTLCPHSSDINTFKKITTADSGRIALEINMNSAILHISSVQISDQRIYKFFIRSPNGFSTKDVSLWVVAPVPSTSETTETETAVFEKVRTEDGISEEVKYSTAILVSILILVSFGFAGTLYWRKKKEIKFFRVYYENQRQNLSVKCMD